MYIHVKFKLCIFRNRFLNISNKDHVGIHYHILHWSMCYIFITRRACKTNHTLWIMLCFSRQICKVWDPRHSLLLGAGGGRGCSSTPHSASSAGGSHFQEWGVLKGGSYFRCYWLFWCYFGYFRPRASAGSSLFPEPSLDGAALAKCWDFWRVCQPQESPSASISPSSTSLPRLFRDKINCSFCPPLPK